MSNPVTQSALYKLCGIDHRPWGCTKPSVNKESTGPSGCPEKSSEDVQRLFQKLLPKGAEITSTTENNIWWTLEWKRGMSGGSLRLKM